MPKKPFKPKVVGHKVTRRSTVLPDSLAALRRDYEEFRENIETRVSDLEGKVRDLTSDVRERNGE